MYLLGDYRRESTRAAKSRVWQYVFPANKLSVDPLSGEVHRHHLGEKEPAKGGQRRLRKASIAKAASCHTFHYPFATHLLKHGNDIRTVQELPESKDVATIITSTPTCRID